MNKNTRIVAPVVHKFWISTYSSVGTSRYRSYVTKADYDALKLLYVAAIKVATTLK